MSSSPPPHKTRECHPQTPHRCTRRILLVDSEPHNRRPNSRPTCAFCRHWPGCTCLARFCRPDRDRLDDLYQRGEIKHIALKFPCYGRQWITAEAVSAASGRRNSRRSASRTGPIKKECTRVSLDWKKPRANVCSSPLSGTRQRKIRLAEISAEFQFRFRVVCCRLPLHQL